ncbi:hypothetical protein [Granulicella sp. dw_53]|uniref:hypothetical protein n=1 Tax=Granulicella sp. dw_53 TaxID=2719792 RepID=UPI001BD4CEF0|nr:hypothetical protein [Granulicella sp. dw_53]
MSLRPALFFQGSHLALLRCASLLVPRRQREEWWKEWQSEVWHVRQARTPEHGVWWSVSWQGEQEVAAFCLGAFQDALCLRQQHRPKAVPLATTMGSAMQCVLFLIGLIAVSYGLGLLLPGVQRELQSSPYRDTKNLMLIQDAQNTDDAIPSISTEQFGAWKSQRQKLFDGFAFYRVEREAVSWPSHLPMTLTVAHGSSNLFDLLGLDARFANPEDRSRGLLQIILSDEVWKNRFGQDPHIAGAVVRDGLREAMVIGVAPSGVWRLPGKVDAWVLEPETEAPPVGLGFVVAHLKPSAEHDRWGERWRMSSLTPHSGAQDFLCVSLAERTHRSWGIFLFTIFLACLSLPATTSLPLGEYRVHSHRLPWSTRLRRWAFLGCKLALLLPVVYFVSLDLAYLRVTFSPVSSDYIQMVVSFSICLFGLRWMLRDQRQRCPVCLGKLTHPARVGEPSRNFLGWNGMELICVGGHGLLHVPEIQTSWFGTQRWLYLDPSWDVLFTESGLASVVDYG